MHKSLRSKLQGSEKVREFFEDELVNLKVVFCLSTMATFLMFISALFADRGFYESTIYCGSLAVLSFIGYQFAKWQKTNK